MIRKMSLFKKKCGYCKKKIEKGREVSRDVKDPVFVGTKEKAFCCKEHAERYIEEVENMEKSKTRRSCCG